MKVVGLLDVIDQCAIHPCISQKPNSQQSKTLQKVLVENTRDIVEAEREFSEKEQASLGILYLAAGYYLKGSCKLKASWNTGNGMKLMTIPRLASGLPETHFGKPQTSTSQTICNRCPDSKQGTVSKFMLDYQDFDHHGFPNMGHGGGGPHGGGSRVVVSLVDAAVSSVVAGKVMALAVMATDRVTTPWLKDCILNGSLALKKLHAFKFHKHKKALDVSHLTSSSSAEVNLDDTDVIPSEFDDIADTFINIPASEDSHGECSDGKVSYKDYCLLAKSRLSTLTKEKRDIVYKLFQAYGKMKIERGEFDLGDFVNDIHQKGLVSEIKQLKQNFRTHAGVLDLAQSVIDIMYRYYIQSIDKLEPEISLISGEPPILLESGHDENTNVAIFGGSKSGEDIVGFGAEQVILVRYDRTKTEVCEFVGKNALILNIVECKGLEFQDVLLYNFCGTSPLEDQWRVIYGYTKKYDWLEDKLPQSFPAFNEARHSVLRSELKQLYVAVTRTRQSLWICENNGKLSKPKFDYWKKRGLVQVRKLDDSVAQAMQVASSGWVGP
ncbi:UvrD-like helicase, ATP-binding domain, P-loop containing nucleoside triphosphate hydrolase [Tanacetum coccineum]